MGSEIQDKINDITGVNSQYRQVISDYEKKHRYCPVCGFGRYVTTLVAIPLDLNNPDAYKDINDCICDACGNKHKMYERV